MCNFHYVAMPMMISQILKSVDFTKTQKSRYLENKTFFLQIKKIIYQKTTLMRVFIKLSSSLVKSSFVKP